MKKKYKKAVQTESTDTLIKVLRQSNQSLETHIDKIRWEVKNFIDFLDTHKPGKSPEQ